MTPRTAFKSGIVVGVSALSGSAFADQSSGVPSAANLPLTVAECFNGVRTITTYEPPQRPAHRPTARRPEITTEALPPPRKIIRQVPCVPSQDLGPAILGAPDPSAPYAKSAEPCTTDCGGEGVRQEGGIIRALPEPIGGFTHFKMGD